MKVFHFDTKGNIVSSDYTPEKGNICTPLYGYWEKLNGIYHENKETLIRWSISIEKEELSKLKKWMEDVKKECEMQEDVIRKLERMLEP